MFVPYYCEGCSAAPLTKYNKNEIKQELAKEKKYFGDNSAKRLCIDMRYSKGYTDKLEKLACSDGGVTLTVQLKKEATKKMRLRVVAYSQDEYWYTRTNKGYIMRYKDYSITKDDDFAV